ncbi:MULTISPECIES: DUF4336 domain-containing protein [Hyphomonas]|uniref:DUF4336 domain-containing protein n=1 Tax=Hyphomonas adhaerens TaxID=81029 RepID=A0A3B9GW26_9PROT|nr:MULTISPECIES: DUF4336 domain-containing protein [Hyphomonas]MBB39034.1 DUF4336 domain-containing protein [Hyphomonas sp.]HAE26631.1 DUF4336 domain-containing protein [Hyphomonas adhaerens]|tara:strand:+ start:650 stop:1351 length:702 start_codon:yes stop_codon:yes gene_type:complete
MLEAVDTDLWLTEGPVVDFHGFPYPTRSIIVRLPDGKLWVWSPVALTPELKAETDALGPVGHLVSPNKIHHLYLTEWHAAYPKAKLWGPASTIRKRSDLPFEPALEDVPPEDWQGVFEQAWFRGSFFMDEIAFVHRPTRTAIFADLSEHFSDDFLKRYWKGWKGVLAKPWGIVVGKGFAPLEWRLSFTNRKPARAAFEKVSATHPDRIIMAHGEWVKTGGEAFLRQAFAWLIR